jgi:UDP-N-acetylglucosamine 4-epimerase
MRILVTGGAGFIGSNLVESLIQDPKVKLVRVLDNLATGHIKNLEKFIGNPKFEFIEGDIRDLNICQISCKTIDAISHQAALGSVPRSIKDPITSHEVNTTGFLNILETARQNGIKRIVYASSSSVYGDSKESPKVESNVGKVLSPYAASKMTNELYAEAFSKNFNMQIFGLRYFNVFGPNQDPNGPYAAVIPLFIKSALENIQPKINGDGTITRDFTPVRNVVQINSKALLNIHEESFHHVLNVACGQSLKLIELWDLIKKITGTEIHPIHGEIRSGDILFSLANISKAIHILGYEPDIDIKANLELTVKYYLNN